MAGKTYSQKTSEIERRWILIDAKDATLGRLSTQIAKYLIGKYKPTYTPHIDSGDYVVVINAAKVALTGKKLVQKTYFRHSGYPGGTTFTPAGQMLENKPERVIELAVRGMLPKNSLGRQMYRKLQVYRGAEHPHAAQLPEVLEINVR